ncbi:hypothetical protein, partial [uncultured Alistipes sp.]
MNLRFRQAAPRQCSNKFGIVLGLHFTCASLGLGRLRLGKMQTPFAFPLGLHYFARDELSLRQAAPRQCSNKFGIVLG